MITSHAPTRVKYLLEFHHLLQGSGHRVCDNAGYAVCEKGVVYCFRTYIYIKYFSKHSSRWRVFPCFQGQMYILVYLMKTRANDITWIMFCVSRNYQQNGAGENVGRYPVQQATTNVADVVSHKGDWWPAISDYSSICRIGISWPFNRVLEIYKMTHLIPL